MSHMNIGRLLALAALSLVACEDTHYVNPETVLLNISDQRSRFTLVEHCYYVPVLLGSQVEADYVIDSDLSATIVVTRSAVTVSFGGDAVGAAVFHVAPKDLQSDVSTFDDAPPAGYTVALRSGCAPDEL